MFHIGQLVVCVEDCPIDTGDQSFTKLEKGRVYTIRDYVTDYVFSAGSHDAIKLEEVVRNRWDDPYGALRFRPVRKTDISIFTDMLNPAPVTEDA